ncbi:phage portal protein [Desulforamulus aquiferis]|uniref:Phage portal protein n=1 Tax=Desulforamulus aquiferis TaxID=1397668 RepID=A0AAW7ZCM3_9FIRM|nr:phage portal protein [Desulforamulus aquiferis]MDO7787137.1 phage portal protein [Desulforamulus aquiferis]
MRATVIKGDKTQFPFQKAEGPMARQGDEQSNEVLTPPYPIIELLQMKEYSTILQQCVDAYKQNICGFGVSLRYREDETKDKETPEMKAEWERVQELIKYWNFDEAFKDVFTKAIEHREYCGNGYIEIIRDGKGVSVGGENVDPKYIKVTRLTEPVEVSYYRGGKQFKRQKRFRRYQQDINGKTVWFKEFGDPRIMDITNGKFEEGIPIDRQANEILHFKIGDGAYGIPRWIAQMIHMYGARKAEELNYRYFYQGRHIPAAIIVSNGQLTEESRAALEEYAKSVEGVENSHKFLLLEVEGEDESPDEDKKKKSNVELKSLAEILQQDALFLEYDDKSRQKLQSSFRLPDIYVGRSKDFNRATAEMAMEITEQQVFIPERESLEFVINNKLFVEHGFKYVDAYFNSPDISNPDDKARLLEVFNSIGAIAPNDVRQDVGKLLGRELENFKDELANIPPSLRQQVSQILMQKSANESIIGILKDLRDVLEDVRHEKN